MAYSYGAAHPAEVKRLVVMTMNIPGFIPAGKVPSWWSVLHQTRDLPEALVQGKELMYLSWFFHNLAYNPSALTRRISTNLLAITLLQAECVPDLSIIEQFHRMQLKIKIIQRLSLQCQYWR